MTEPSIVAYPAIAGIAAVPAIKNRMCYFVKPYAMDGVALVIYGVNGGYKIRVGDFKGNAIDPATLKKGSVEYTLLSSTAPKLMQVMRYAKIQQAEYYFSGKMLIDVRVSANKFVSPGMLKDLFGKVTQTQEIMKVAVANDDEINRSGKAVLKPAVFKTISDDSVDPMYCVTQ